MLFLSRDYCTKREAFGQYLVHYPLHMRTLAGIEVSTLLTIIIAPPPHYS